MDTSLIIFISSGVVIAIIFVIRYFELGKEKYLLSKTTRFIFDRYILKILLEIFKIIDRIQNVISREILHLPKRIWLSIKFTSDLFSSTYKKIQNKLNR